MPSPTMERLTVQQVVSSRIWDYGQACAATPFGGVETTRKVDEALFALKKSVQDLVKAAQEEGKAQCVADTNS